MNVRIIMSVALLACVCLPLASCLEADAINAYQQLREEITKIDNYLEDNPPASGDILVKDESGVRLVITEMGSGTIPPTPQNILQVSYVGRMLSKGELTAPFEEDPAFTFTITSSDVGPDVITGWKIALGMMTQGTKARAYIPSSLGYGGRGSGDIPGNAILVFDLELNVVNTSDQEPRLTQDIAKITEYIEDKEIANVQVHPSGLRYVSTLQGTGDSPGLYDQVVIRYTGKLMNATEDVFDSNIVLGPVAGTFSSRPANYIHGLTLGLQLMSEEGKMTFYLPSVLGYGQQVVSDVPANSVLIYEVELLEVIRNP